jgi:hypothetical protein
MQVTEGSSGEIVFTGVLDHNDFPPTIDGGAYTTNRSV